jgi:hypothetical protein
MEARLRILRCVAGLAVAGFVASCAGTGQPQPARVDEPVYEVAEGRVLYMTSVPVSSRTVLRKDYTLGARRTAAVGEVMLSVENYTVSDRVAEAVALEPFAQPCKASRGTSGSPARSKPSYRRSAGNESASMAEDAVETAPGTRACQAGRVSYVRGAENDRFTVAGAFREGGNLYYLIEFNAGSEGTVYLAADARGRVKAGDYLFTAPAAGEEERIATPLGVPLRVLSPSASLQRESPLFRFDVEESVDSLAPDFQHFALLYEGTTYDHRGMVYHLLYREYRRDESDLPLFEQSLAFAGETSTIDLLGFRMRVHDVDDRQIIYTVQRD